MIDKGVKKVTVPTSSFPAVTLAKDSGNELFYLFRYRVTSEDGTKFSAWSPKYALKSANSIKSIFNNGADITNKIISNGTSMTTTWNIPSGLINNTFDVYTRWGSVGSNTEYSITGLAVSSKVITFTTSSSHGYAVGNQVSVYGINDTVNRSYKITSVGTNTFSATCNLADQTVTVSGKVKKITFDSSTQSGSWTYSATTTSNNFHIDIPTSFLSTSATLLPDRYKNFMEIYVQIAANPKQLIYSSESPIPTAILNPYGSLFNSILSTYPTSTDGGIIS
jgi:hypothetical protein